MKSLASALKTQAAAAGQAPTLLCEVADWGGTTERFALSDAPVPYNGNVYLARRFAPGSFQAATEQASSSFQVIFDNTDLALSELCAANDPKGLFVSFLRVYLDNLSVAEAKISGLAITGYRLTETAATFTLVPGDANRPSSIPARIAQHACGWLYKSTLCGYAGALASCDHTLADCVAHANLLNYGGIPPVIPAS